MTLRRLCLAAAFTVAAFVLIVPARALEFSERLQLCLACHGETGTSTTDLVPSLGGQPAPYLVIQLFMFRQKLRTVEPMNDMAEGITDAELQKFADIIAAQPPPSPEPGPAIAPDRAERGARLIAQHRCAFCHNNLSGADSIPRIAAQREDYLLKALRDYKSGARTEYQPVMAEVMLRLSDADIVDLAHFLARTPAP